MCDELRAEAEDTIIVRLDLKGRDREEIRYPRKSATRKKGASKGAHCDLVANQKAKGGRGDWIRTSDLSVPNRALYQAEPRPDESLV